MAGCYCTGVCKRLGYCPNTVDSNYIFGKEQIAKRFENRPLPEGKFPNMELEKNDILYVTVMLRFGDPESHHYITGVFSTYEKAKLSGEVEKSWRGGKYEYQIQEIPFNTSIPDEKLKYHYRCI